MTPLSDDRLRHLRNLLDQPDLSGTKFELIEKIAAGGMGTVFRARDRELDRHVALKVLTIPDASGAFTARMIREAKIVAQLEHPGIVPVHDVGRLPDNRVYYTMKFVEGETLEEYRSKNPPLSSLLRIFQRVCDAVEFAHSRGVLHRDLKPSNIMVGAFGEVLVMDWGIAVRRTEDAGREPDSRSSAQAAVIPDTAHGTILGTPAYMSPEQANGEIGSLTERTDIYGLGAILYFLLTGVAPYSGETMDAILGQVTAGRMSKPRAVVKSIPRRLEAICLKAMSTDPTLRYPSADAFSADVTLYLDGQPVSAYPENIAEKSARWLTRNQFIVFVILAYIILRLIFLFWSGI